MYNFSAQKAVTKKPTVKVGIYESKVTSVHWAEDYADETAFEVEYTLTSSNGKKFHHSELFYTLEKSPSNERTINFYAYLSQNGLTDLSEFEGCYEKLTFKKNVHKNRTFVEIVEREFLGKSEK
ncbi:MAG: hypothetical protein IJW21_09395 [Clostridia bacterium]|nr:hypothetical protein [Clostridia bacterium]